MDELKGIDAEGYMPFIKAAKEAYKNYYSDKDITPGLACIYHVVLKGIIDKDLIGNEYISRFLDASPEQLAGILWDYLLNKGYRFNKITEEILDPGKGYRKEPTPIVLEFAREHLIPLLQSRAKEMYADSEDTPSVDALAVWGVGYQHFCWILLNMIDPSKKVLRLHTVYKLGSPVYQIFLEHANLKKMPKKKPVTESATITKKINSVLSFLSNPVYLYREHCVKEGTQLSRYLNQGYQIPKVFHKGNLDGTDWWDSREVLALNPEQVLRTQKHLTAILNRRKKILSLMPSSYLDMYLDILTAMSSKVMELITLKPGSSLRTIAELLLEGVSPERIAKLAYSRHSKNLKPIQP